jgi:hypothetical protein
MLSWLIALLKTNRTVDVMTGAKVLAQISGLILSLFKLLENLFFFRQIQESLKIKNAYFKKDL